MALGVTQWLAHSSSTGVYRGESRVETCSFCFQQPWLLFHASVRDLIFEKVSFCRVAERGVEIPSVREVDFSAIYVSPW